MNDDSINTLLNNTPEPDANAKKRAVNLAMAEFQVVQQEKLAQPDTATKNNSSFIQGFLNWFRPTGNNNPSRSNTMNISRHKFIITGMTSCAVAVIGVLLFNQTQFSDDKVLTSPTFSEQQLSDKQKNIPSVSKPEPSTVEDAVVEEVVVTGVRESINEAESDQSISDAEYGQIIATEAPPPSQEIAARSRELKKESANAAAKIATSRLAAQSKPYPMPASPVSDMVAPAPEEYRDRFEEFKENSVISVKENPVSTFSIDVDTASYSFVRRSLNAGHLPEKDSVRIEEMINYFDYEYPAPKNANTPFQPNVVVVDSPWKKGNKLIHIGIQGYEIAASQTPRSNLVFLLDVSGSMNSPDKLPLVQQSMELLLNNLKPDDTIAIAVYAGAAGTVLEPTKVKEKQKILSAIQQLQAGGSTAGAEGIQLAYQLAEANFDPKAVNRILLATDGDFNVGHTGDSDLKTFVERKRDKGIYLSVLGFGRGNYQDAMMQTLAQNGNGVAAYIDTLSEAQKVLVHQATSMLFPIASDVKIQVEFNPATVAEYRLIGYETRALKREDFNNDKVDAGEIGSGHSVTAMYEITPVGEGKPLLEPSRYQKEESTVKKPAKNEEYAFLRIRYKRPGEQTSQLLEQAIDQQHVMSLTQNMNADSPQHEAGFATAVAGFAQLLRGSNFIQAYSYDDVIALAQQTKGSDEFGYRTEFIQLVRKAKVAKAL